MTAFTRRQWLRSAASCVLGAGSAPYAADAQAHGLQTFYTPAKLPPTLPLTLHDGRVTSLQAVLTGRVTVLQLMFTSCSATCPIQGGIFANVQQRLEALPQPVRNAQLVSLSIDPLSDSPQAMQAWRNKFGAHVAWLGATPDLKALDPWLDFLQGRAVGVDKHSVQAYFFNPQGRLAMQTADFPQPERLVTWVQELARQKS